MEYRQRKRDAGLDEIINELERLRRFRGPPSDFWPAFLENSTRLAGARLGLLLAQGKEEGSWDYLSLWPARNRKAVQASGLEARIEEVAEASLLKRYAWNNTGKVRGIRDDGVLLGVHLELEDERSSVAVFLLDHSSQRGREEVAMRLKIVTDTPLIYQLGRLARQAQMDVVQFSEGLDVMVLLNEQKRYLASAMTLCNEVASRYRCERVSLGWLKGEYIRLQAMSHMEKFEKKMDAVQSLEAAMEEAFDQDEEIVWPREEKSTTVTRDHESFSREQASQYLVSVPLRLDGEPVAVLTCERSNEPFSEGVIRGLRLLCDQAVRRLGDLKEQDRWFGARLMSAAREALGRLVGVEHTFARLMGLLLCAALAFLLFGTWSYRVEAPFILKTDDVTFLPAPFDGYIDEVHVKVGDLIEEGELLLSLDTRELLLEESTAIANQNRYVRESDKALADKALGEMRIAQALADQAKAQLDLVRYRLNHAEIRSPFTGIIVEGDLRELLGAPTRQGDVLFKVSRLEEMYAELEVEETDVHEVAKQASGEIAFVSRPDLKFPIQVERLDPVALTREERNVFLVRGVLSGEVADWWRPGMSGVAKINVGKRNILWILTHRTVDFLRMFFWW